MSSAKFARLAIAGFGFGDTQVRLMAYLTGSVNQELLAEQNTWPWESATNWVPARLRISNRNEPRSPGSQEIRTQGTPGLLAFPERPAIKDEPHAREQI